MRGKPHSFSLLSHNQRKERDEGGGVPLPHWQLVCQPLLYFVALLRTITTMMGGSEREWGERERDYNVGGHDDAGGH